MWDNLITMVGTLSGCLMTGVVSARVSRSERRETRWDTRQSQALTAITALVTALANHRRAMWVLEDLRLSTTDMQKVAGAVEASQVTRSAVTTPLTTVRILIPALADPARQATQATYAMRNAPDHAALEVLRREALEASDRLEDAAAALFAAAGGVLTITKEHSA